MAAILQNLNLESFLTPDTLWPIVRALLLAVLWFIVLRVVVIITRRILARRTTAQVTMLVTKGINYIGLALIITFLLLEFGVNLAPILGAAGIVGLAVGIASQASLSNMISGLFLVSEKPFSVGDVIRTGDTVGVVDSIDLLSVKIRTFDNLYIRVPNEKLANSQLTNITRYPIRRMDFTVRVNYGQEISRVQEILLDIARDNEKCLQEPAPIVLCQDYTDYGPRILFGVWFLRADYIQVKNSVFAEILQRFAREGIGIPVAPRSLQLAPGAEPFPVRVVDPFADPGPGNVDAQPDMNK